MKKENQEEKIQDNDKGFIITAAIITLVIFGLWIATYFLLKDKCETDRGTFGDMFGSVNALFSGMALSGIILTILLQRNELKLQRAELRQTRTEFQTQNETLKTQRFENTFFNLLNLHHQIVNAIDFRYYKKKEKIKLPSLSEEKEVVVIKGRDVFRHKYHELSYAIKEDASNYEQIYMKHYKEMQLDFGHYFRNLYRMIKLVDENNFAFGSGVCTVEEQFRIKYQYTSMIRAQLSDYELSWLFYNCLCEYGVHKFKPLIERYSLFKNLPSDLIPFHDHLTLYSASAYNPYHRII